LLRRPTHKASVDLVLNFLGSRGELAANVLYIGERRDLDPAAFGATTTADDYVTLNLTGRFKINDWLTVFGRFDNVTDENYEDVLGFGTAGVSAYWGIRLEY
jgi:vitamin B12 transporter